MYAANGSVEVIVTNTSRQVARVPKWQLPSSELQANLFRISRDGQPSPMRESWPSAACRILRTSPSCARARATARSSTCPNAYDMTKPGRYTITLASPLQQCIAVRRQHPENRSRAADAAAERAAAGLERRPPQTDQETR
jgi:hypothetical protein